LSTIVSGLRRADPWLLIAGMMLGLLTRFAAAERTQVISRALGLLVSRRQTVETLFISNFYALLSPGPVLSGVVTVYRYKNYGASVTGSVGSLLASRAIECAVFVVLGTACVLLDPRIALNSVEYPLQLAIVAIAAIAVATCAWWLLHKRHHRNGAPVALSPNAADGVVDKLRAVWHDVVSRGPRMALQAAIPATVQVILAGAAVAVLARSLSIDMSLVTAIWVSAAVYAVVLLPISIAGLGVREVTLIKSLGLLGVSAQSAVALSVLLFADPVVNAMIGGVLQFRSAMVARAR
jgi:uncharacterized membrane protein YbhN (UPF0104 family)